MSEKIPTDIDYVKYQADQLESMVKQRSHQRRILLKFISENRRYLRWWDNYLKTRCDSTLVRKVKEIITSMEARSPK